MYTANESRYDKMIYRRCGNSGVMLPALSLGLWHNFGGTDSFENQRLLVRRAFDLGITHFDLANNYGPPAGSAEENFGRILKSDLAAYRDQIIISTKAGHEMWPGPYGDHGSKKHIIASCEQSLKRLQVDYVDIFYHHRPDPDTPMEETMAALAQLVHQGKALYIGISKYSPEQTKQAVKILGDMGIHCLIHQFRYNIFDRGPENGVLSTLKDEGVGSIAFSPLSQGLLSGRYFDGIPSDSRAAKTGSFLKREQVTDDTVTKARKLSKIAANRGQTLPQMALAWVLRNTTSAIIGTSRVSQLEENINVLNNLSFSEDELDSINSISGK